jgi:hypothetical protein
VAGRRGRPGRPGGQGEISRAAASIDTPGDAALVLLSVLEGGSMLSHVRRRQVDPERVLDAALISVGATQL